MGCVACLVCALGAPGALAGKRDKPKPSYSGGAYTGKVALPVPAVVPGSIGFVVSRGSITALNLKVVELCGGTIWSLLGDSPKALTIPVGAAGGFSYDRTVSGDHLELHGHLKGSQATGTVFDSLKTGTLVCAMSHPATFTARR